MPEYPPKHTAMICNITRSTTQSLLHAMHLYKDRMQIPRTSLAIYNGINAAFPEECDSQPSTLRLLDAFAPVLIAGNEAADIGISARLNRGNKQSNFSSLLTLENMTKQVLQSKADAFTSEYPQHAAVAHNFTADLMILSSNRAQFSDKFDVFLEVDSAIFEAACIQLCAPSVLRHAGVDFAQPVATPEQLIKKYMPFLSMEPHVEDLPIVNRLKSLHAIEMLLKIDDDTRGVEPDTLLGLPSFVTWATTRAHETNRSVDDLLNEKKESYFDILRSSPYMSVPMVNIIRGLCELTSIHKAQRTGVDNHIPLPRLPYFHRFTTTLRHELYSTGILHDLFMSEVATASS